MNRFTLEQCGGQRKLRDLKPGTYHVEYTDGTHLPPTTWVRLAIVEIIAASIPLGDEETEQFYTIQKAISNFPTEAKVDASESSRRSRVIDDTLGLAIGRTGLISPVLTEELFEELVSLGEEDGVVIVPDTNALHNGAVHWLLRVLRKPSVWLLPLAASLTTVQTRDATVKGLVGKEKLGNVKQALRSRGLVNGALGLLRRNRGRSQVVEIDHSLLRYQKTGSSSGSDPDQSDVLEDRLIIEAIHSVLRTMRSRTARRVVTSDVNLARVLEAEGINTLFVPTIVMGDAPIECIQYDTLAHGFVGAPLRTVLWELAHAFGNIRLVRNGTVLARLECYWPGKTPREWENESLNCEFSTFTDEGVKSANVKPTLQEVDPEAPQDPVIDPVIPRIETKTDREPRSAAGSSAALAERVRERQKKSAQTLTRRSTLGSALPRASLPLSLRLLGRLRRSPGSTPEQMAQDVGNVTPDTVRRACDLLLRLGLASAVDGRFEATKDAGIVDGMLITGDLDGVSSILERFTPYKVLRTTLVQRGSMLKGEVADALRPSLGSVGKFEAERLPRYHVLLGQAWTDGDRLFDGSQRPTDRDATEAFDYAFETTAMDGLARVVDFLPEYCRLSSMSPWAAKRQISRFLAERLLQRYSFQPSAGGKPIVRDEVLVGGLEAIAAEPVVIDRLHLGERPVFTIGGSRI